MAPADHASRLAASAATRAAEWAAGRLADALIRRIKPRVVAGAKAKVTDATGAIRGAPLSVIKKVRRDATA